MFERLERLIGKEAVEKINQKKILLVGVGGVGGTVLEALVRSGIKNITIADGDVFDESNLNRQILSTQEVIGQKKVDVAKKRVFDINRDANIQTIDYNLTEESISNLDKNYDFIIDACDDVKAKLELMKFAEFNNISIICSMGTGKRLNPSMVKISTLNKTYNDPLSKKIRYEAKKMGINTNIPVVFSEELPYNSDNVVASSIFVPSCAALNIAYYVIKKIIKP